MDGLLEGVFDDLSDVLSAGSAGWPPGGSLPKSKSGIFLCKWHKKLAGLRGKHLQPVTSVTVQGI
ncbi:hypothetical protein [Bradyrhizobium sp. OAE829]|uniref:hypothetical protein n=1 Tax=Bradyrhizobium sp. OAE829 TaxID=2663807 RepID=UPI00178971A1